MQIKFLQSVPRLLLMVGVFSFGCKSVAPHQSAMPHQADPPALAVQEAPVVLTDTLRKQPRYQAARTKVHDLLHTRLDLSFDWAKKAVIGEAALDLKAHFYDQKEVTLDAVGFTLNWVKLKVGDDWTDVDFDYDSSQLKVTLPRAYGKDELVKLRINYIAHPYDQPSEGSKAIKDDKGLYFINADSSRVGVPQQIWSQGETQSNSRWFPTIDSPNQKSTEEMYLTVDKRYKTLSNGVLIYSRENSDGTRTDYWKMDQPHAPYLFMVAVGDFVKVEDHWKNIPVNYWMERDYAPYAKKIFGNTPEMIEFFSKKLNYPFPWPKYDQIVVRDFVSGAMENTTASVFMDQLNVDSIALKDYNWDYIIAHELFHHWFGDLVTCESWANLPLNEAFANFSEAEWLAHKYGKAEGDYHNYSELQSYLAEAATKQEKLIRYQYKNREDMFDAHSYSKGGLILKMLEDLIGEKAFYQGLNLYLTEHAYKNAEVAQLRLAFEEVTGQDLSWFFNQWFHAAGHPILKVNQTYEAGELVVTMTQTQDFDKTPLYRLPLEVDVWANGQKSIHQVVLEDEQQVFKFSVGAKPDLVLVDPEQHLVGVVKHEKSEKEWTYQYEKAENAIARISALENIDQLQVDSLDIDVQVYHQALKDSVGYIRDWALNHISTSSVKEKEAYLAVVADLAEHDTDNEVRSSAMWVLGEDAAAEYRMLFKRNLSYPSYQVRGTALMGYVRSHPSDANEVVEQFAGEKDLNMVVAVASYYAENSMVDKKGWFEEKIDDSENQELWYLIQYYGELLMNAPEKDQRAGAQRLKNLAINSEDDFTRMVAFQSLNFLSFNGLQEIILEVQSSEKNQKLLKNNGERTEE
ncbi:M1 family metallopeptidase [Persicobacter psychrovividus]|uniref:Aminopeptidase N n=1 Tax=Persicobacter psychrovividus TaxID=387638 RepID=A0ABM7VH89_9BACT|nr:hypothetical protein PEPS_23740 [Persicobacter psychrovividus]